MSNRLGILTRINALTTLLNETLEGSDADDFANDRLRADLRALGARTKAELDTVSGRRHLQLADEPSDLVNED